MSNHLHFLFAARVSFSYSHGYLDHGVTAAQRAAEQMADLGLRPPSARILLDAILQNMGKKKGKKKKRNSGSIWIYAFYDSCTPR